MFPLISLLFILFSFTVYGSPAVTERCNETGMADSYVLALSSQPGFCETYGFEQGKPECRKLTKDSYQAAHLTLHGLWPNLNACGHHYGYCGVKPKSNHCDYPPLSFSQKVSEQLTELMPSYHFGSCLERHEWYKHGSCQILTPDEYFGLAMRLLTSVDQSIFGHYLTNHRGKRVQLSALHAVIKETFGQSNVSKIYLGCSKGVLVDVYIQLPALIPLDASLDRLINEAPNDQHADACPNQVRISDFTKESWY